MIKKLFKRNTKQKLEKLRTKAIYRLKDLYVGEIVYFNNREYIGYDKCQHYYNTVKKFAIFIDVGHDRYLHIKSGQNLIDLYNCEALVGEYTVRNVREFQRACPIFMRKNNYTPNTKISKASIEEYENKINEALSPDIEVIDLFK